MPQPVYRGSSVAGWLVWIGGILVIVAIAAIAINLGNRPNPIIGRIDEFESYYRTFTWAGAGLSLGLLLWLAGIMLGALDRVEAQLYELHQTIYNGDTRTPASNPPPARTKSALDRLAGTPLPPLKE